LLLALARGPGFGLELIANVATLSRGLLRLNRGGAYLALRALEEQGLVHGWMRRLPGRGRPRRYYELTPEGILRADEIRRAFGAFAGIDGRAVTPEEAQQMADRVNEGADLSADAIRLRDAGRRAGL
jgi:DNA-binding PadR family transcriptional regulator